MKIREITLTKDTKQFEGEKLIKAGTKVTCYGPALEYYSKHGREQEIRGTNFETAEAAQAYLDKKAK